MPSLARHREQCARRNVRCRGERTPPRGCAIQEADRRAQSSRVQTVAPQKSGKRLPMRSNSRRRYARSNSTTCPTRMLPRSRATISPATSENVGASERVDRVMPCSQLAPISSAPGTAIRLDHSSTTSPTPEQVTIADSTTRDASGSSPVVSTSTTASLAASSSQRRREPPRLERASRGQHVLSVRGRPSRDGDGGGI